MEHSKPLLLLDNSTVMSVMGEGEFQCHRMTFDETRAVLDTFDEKDVRLCFTNSDIVNIIFGYLGIENKNYQYKAAHHIDVGQEALIFKLITTQSETQPVIAFDDGWEAKKIQNVYVYMQYMIRVR